MPIEAIATYPLPGMNVPGTIAFSPDDQLITYLHSADASLVRQLYAYRPATGQRQLLLAPADTGTTEEQLSIEEALRRERQRQRELGVTTYAWAKHTNRILVPLNDGLYAQDGVDAPLRKIVSSQGHPVLDPQWSPDGTQIAYVQDAELYVVSAAGGDPRQLTDGARGTGKTHGLAEYIAQEEMDRSHGFWWSQDSAWLAFTEVDETHIPIYRIVHQAKTTSARERKKSIIIHLQAWPTRKSGSAS
jgi:dipeptidyl-peptidase-4